jgi:hypothetical protein
LIIVDLRHFGWVPTSHAFIHLSSRTGHNAMAAGIHMSLTKKPALAAPGSITLQPIAANASENKIPRPR